MDSGPVASYQVHEHLRPKVRASFCRHLSFDDYVLKTNHIMFLPGCSYAIYMKMTPSLINLSVVSVAMD